MGLSVGEIAQMQFTQTEYWPDTATIQTLTRTRDDQGGWTEAWANTYTSVACRLYPETASQKERIGAEQIQAITNWIFTVAHDQAIDETMRVVHDSQTYEVARVEDTHSYRTAQRAHLVRLD